jgi:hypothetical protein
MSDFEKDVQGLALYIELRRPLSTIQIVMTPEGFTPSNGVKQPIFFRRTLSSGVTKRKWRTYSIALNKVAAEALQRNSKVDEDVLDEQMTSRLRNLKGYFESAASQGYKMMNNPIYVEVTKEDIESANNGNLPAKLWTRIKSSKVAAGYPETVVSPTSAFTTPTPLTTPAF